MDPEAALEKLNLIWEIPESRLGQLYVPRPDDAFGRITTLLRGPSTQKKLLLAGQHGSGKTTELNRVSVELSRDYAVVRCGSHELMEMEDASDEVDFFLVLVRTLAQSAERWDPKGPQRILDYLYEALRGEAGGRDTFRGTSQAVQLPVGVDVVSITGWIVGQFLKQEAKTPAWQDRKQTKDILRNYRPQLNSVVIKAIETIEEISGRPVLLIVDDLEKVEYSQVRTLLGNFSSALSLLPCSAIFTVSPWLLFDGELLPRLRDQFEDIDLANVPLFPPDGGPSRERDEYLMIIREVRELSSRKPIERMQAIVDQFMAGNTRGSINEISNSTGGKNKGAPGGSAGRQVQSNSAIRFMVDVLERRVGPLTNEPGTLSALIVASGGNLRQCMRMTHNAFADALREGKKLPGESNVRRVVLKAEQDFRRILTSDHRKVLERVYKEKAYSRESPEAMLANLSVLEYWHDTWGTWYDVNPLAKWMVTGKPLSTYFSTAG